MSQVKRTLFLITSFRKKAPLNQKNIFIHIRLALEKIQFRVVDISLFFSETGFFLMYVNI